MSKPPSAKALISYAHENPQHGRLVKDLSDRLRQDGVECEIDQYHDVPLNGWPQWMSQQIFDEERFILVVASPSYVRRWSLAEKSGVGLGAKYEGKLIRQVLYSEEGLNGRIIPIVMAPNDIGYVPPELQDTTRYDVSTNINYDLLLRRLTQQPVGAPSTVGEPVGLLAEQPPPLASVFYILQSVAAPFPVKVLCETAETTCATLQAATESEELAPVLFWHDGDLLTTTYYRPVHPSPPPPDLLSRALEALLGYLNHYGVDAATRDQIKNVLALANAEGVRPDVVARVFGIVQKALKRLGDKRLVWRAAELTLAAAGREYRQEQDAREEALTLICGRSWVLQRVGRLDEAKADAERSLELGRMLGWHRNTAFCLKCLGRLSRMQAEVLPEGAERKGLLAESEQYLRKAIEAFTRLDEHDTEEEVGECHSLLGRSWLVAGQLKEAREEAAKAEPLLGDSASKEYQDLQILHGDLVVRSDLDLAESFYSEVIQQGVSADAQYSEIRARAFYARGLCRRTQRRRPEAKKDFTTAAEIWTNLQDPAASLAEWDALKCEDRLLIEPTLLESDPPAVRVRVIRNHRERLKSFGARPARREASVGKSYVDHLVAKARKQIAIEDTGWVLRITGDKT